MNVPNEGKIPEVDKASRHWKYLPLVAEIWIFATIALFFIVRVLGSSSARHLLRTFQGH